MLIKDSFILHAGRETVWAALQDIERVATCVPGVESVSQDSDDVYHGLLKIRIGPIAASFNGQARFVERVEPERLVAEVSGEDKTSASLVKATFTGWLANEGSSTRLDYEVDVALRGRLGQFGGAVVTATAKKMTADFARRLDKMLAESAG